jgi:hypothetical protein
MHGLSCANSEMAAASLSRIFPHRATAKRYVRSGNTGASADLYSLIRKLTGAPQMREHLASKSRNAKRFRPRGIAPAALCASLMAGIAYAEPTMAIAQALSSDMQPQFGMRITSPLAARSAQPAGIPPGSTEIATPGSSPVVPSQGSVLENCSGTDDAQSSGAPFDGGGMSEAAALSCADSPNISSPLPSPSSIGPVRIPLGATEISGAGISPAAPVAGPALVSGMGSTNSTPATNGPGNP